MGAVFRVPVEIGAELPSDGLRVGLDPGAETPLWDADLAGPVVLAVGAERRGLPEEVLEACDRVCAIPQAAGAESLNAAQAATLGLYEAVRQRVRTAGTGPSPT
jgi:tRNA G18 (ribose-2'-O)-methylase SpoU